MYLAGGRVDRLSDVTLEIRADVTAVVGPSGAGKTSLLNLLVGFERATLGRIEADLPRQGFDLPLFWVPPQEGLWPHLSVREHLLAVSADAGAAARAEDLLRAFDLDGAAHAHPDRLSQGERSRLAVARALAARPAVLVMDEPLVHVAPARADDYWRVLREHVAASGASLVFSTHAPERVLSEAQRVICMSEGRVLYEGAVANAYWRPPSAEVAEALGPCNWFGPGEAEVWLGQNAQDTDPHPRPGGPLPQKREGALKPSASGGGHGEGSSFRRPQDTQSPHPGPLPKEEGGRPSRFREPVCIRPEQLHVTPADSSPLRVESSRFAGSVAEVTLVHESAGARRRFFHRPASPNLLPGVRVLLKVCLILLLMVAASGCDAAAEPALPVRAARHLAMPSDGIRSPAPRGVTMGNDGELLTVDTSGRIVVFDKERRPVRQWFMPETSVGRPESLLVLRDGRIAVPDTHYHRVVFFDQRGNILGMFGSLGRGPGEFIYPVSIAEDDAGNLYVCEYGENDRVQKFTSAGEYILGFGSFGTGPDQLQRPSGIVWHAGKVYVADAVNGRVQVFTDDGRHLGALGAASASGAATSGGGSLPALSLPYDIALAPDASLVVVEYGAGRVTKLGLDGAVLGRYGTTGRGAGEFSTPWGVAVDDAGAVWIADTGNRRLVELTF